MTYLLDTVVVSEWTKPSPDAHAIAWLAAQDEATMYLSVATFAELRQGIALMPTGRKRERLAAWLTDDLAERFAGRTLTIDRQTAEMWGVLAAQVRQSGLTVGPMDLFIASTAVVHNLTIATRNIRDFAGLPIAVINPWEPSEPAE